MANHKIALTSEVMRALEPIARRRNMNVAEMLEFVGIEGIDVADPRNDQAAFMDMLLAAMCDAALTHHITQLQTKLVPPGTTKEKVIRIIVVPDELDFIMGGD